MAQMTDIMVDVETTGKNPNDAAIIQLAAVKFNYDTGEIGETFDRAPSWLPRRYWDEDTREFWMKHKNVYDSIIARSEPALPVFQDFADFALSDHVESGLRFWAKPTTFDWPFVASHYEQLDLKMPFLYRTARDMNSVIAALHGSAEHVSYEDIVPNVGQKHNALHDCAWQIDCLFHAKNKFILTEIVS